MRNYLDQINYHWVDKIRLKESKIEIFVFSFFSFIIFNKDLIKIVNRPFNYPIMPNV